MGRSSFSSPSAFVAPVLLLLLLLLSLILCGSTTSARSSNLALKQVHVITRHGDRTPLNKLPGIEDPEWNCYTTLFSYLDTYPSFFPDQEHTLSNVPRVYSKSYIPGKNFFKGNCSAGQLTNIGAWQHFHLGQKFHDYYINRLGFLNATFDPETVWIRSTDVPRTLESAQSQLLALFPPSKAQSPNKQVIPISTIEASQEYLYPNPTLCPLLNTMYDQLRSTPQWKAHEESAKPLKEKLAAYFNVSLNALPGWSTLMDQFHCRSSHNIPYPPGISQEIVDSVNRYAEWELNYLFSDRSAAKYSMGPFLQEILQNMQNTMSGASRRRWIYYSAHDTTVGPVLLALQAFGDKVPVWPPYAAHIVIELYNDRNAPGEWWMQLIYNDEPLVLPGCGQSFCSFATFANIVNSLTPKDYKAECFAKKLEHQMPFTSSFDTASDFIPHDIHPEAEASLMNAN